MQSLLEMIQSQCLGKVGISWFFEWKAPWQLCLNGCQNSTGFPLNHDGRKGIHFGFDPLEVQKNNKVLILPFDSGIRKAGLTPKVYQRCSQHILATRAMREPAEFIAKGRSTSVDVGANVQKECPFWSFWYRQRGFVCINIYIYTYIHSIYILSTMHV